MDYKSQDLGQFAALVEIIAHLRSPQGCPWDRKQTHESLRKHLISESYETLEALDEGNMAKLREELGDLLLQIMLHARIAEDCGEFTINDVIRGLNEKLIHRHPHVFAEGQAETAEDVSRKWEELKKEERPPDATLLGSVPKWMPALAYSQDVQGRAARAGFDWKDDSGVTEKLVEEIEELKNAANPAEKQWEFGDVLFTLVNIARRTGIDSETALREANTRFFKRFSYMEKLCRERGVTFSDLSFEAQNKLWDEAKKAT